MTEADTRQHADFARQAWHAMQPEELEHALETDLDAGLSEGEIEKRRERFGANRLTPQSRRTLLMRFIGQFNNLFIYLLLAAAAVAGGLDEWLDTTLEFARTLAVNALVVGEIFYLLNSRFFHAPSWTLEGLLGNRVVLLAIGGCLALQLLFTYAPFMNALFGTEPLNAEAWSRCLAVGLVVFVVVEFEKLVVRRRLSGQMADRRGEVERTHGENGTTDPANGARRKSRDVTHKEGDDTR